MERLADNHVSVDCVVIGFDGEDLNVLLVKRTFDENGEYFSDMKLPGGLIYEDEDLDCAAKRILKDLTGLGNIQMRQFKAYGSAHRTDDPKDVHWLEKISGMNISRIITVAYIAALNIDEDIKNSISGTEAVWMKVDDVPRLPFDHNVILSDSLGFLKRYLAVNDSLIFSILPKKFTILQYRLVLEAITGKKIDNANIYKKIAQLPYIVPLNEKEPKISHRSARYYHFDKEIWENC